MERIYTVSLNDTPGVVAANNFLSIFVPANSNKFNVGILVSSSSYSTGMSSTPNSMLIQRTTAASGGTLLAASNIPRFTSTDEDPVSEVRTGNPTVSLFRTPLLGYTPPLTTGAGAGATYVETSPPGAAFTLFPGQGVVWYTTAGNVNQMWNLQVVWQEFYLPK